jgi:glutathione synthase/RimK-type ligase-like ATP-grasp enzyme
MNHPADMAVMFDKSRCHRRLAGAGLPVPPALDPVRSYDELVERMHAARCLRVFVKPAHGSSASGVVAYQTNGREHHATTTVEAVRRDGDLVLYNSKRLRVYRDPGEIAAIVDALCRQRVHVEQWLPKAGLGGRTFDLRVVVIAGRTRHVVARLSRGPITNLHLDNAREGPARVRARLGEAAWAAAVRDCERALACFPDSLYAGVDLLVGADFRRHAILEVNAFGDLLLETYLDGLDTYATEVLALLADDGVRAPVAPAAAVDGGVA